MFRACGAGSYETAPLAGTVLAVLQPQKRRQDRRIPNLGEPVEEYVPEAGGGEEPGAAVV